MTDSIASALARRLNEAMGRQPSSPDGMVAARCVELEVFSLHAEIHELRVELAGRDGEVANLVRLRADERSTAQETIDAAQSALDAARAALARLR